MLRDGSHKYVHYVGDAPQLFDMVADPDETHDLAADSSRAKASQRHLLDAAGGPEAVLAGGVKIPYTPPPALFDPAEPRDRAS